MTQRGRRTALGERIEIGEQWEAGQRDPEIAATMGLSVWTVRKWRRKYQEERRSGLASRMGRPATGALGQFPLEIRDTVREMRTGHPGWGPLTILAELEDELGKNLNDQTLEITFDFQSCELIGHSEDGKQEIRLPVLGLTKIDLMGELTPLIALPAYQLALPFSRPVWRQITLCNNLTGTTL
ncbi:MAG: helix-turn-helix domain containing protein [Anaerolineae bacterium]|nr:MAG: helix-turn-helix domain containing protein [Anaerolineae bacterium]